MKILGQVFALTVAVSSSVGVSNANEDMAYKPTENNAVAIKVAIDEALRLSKTTEEMRIQHEEARLEAIRAATAEAIRLSNYCGSAIPQNCNP